jgi:hypothetical protein
VIWQQGAESASLVQEPKLCLYRFQQFDSNLDEIPVTLETNFEHIVIRKNRCTIEKLRLYP